ncbi:hypothetical protein CEXT_645351 [Caerostris extrusa]|uniref:Uncharacterized protein n=1 Tax=Caerostris extrusa TaxID=172846 RepID=A0AAV4UQN4_CAEEX|nr:hypothetical protein CEXT_645351 [Caerostris extrusa]
MAAAGIADAVPICWPEEKTDDVIDAEIVGDIVPDSVNEEFVTNKDNKRNFANSTDCGRKTIPYSSDPPPVILRRTSSHFLPPGA